MNVNLVGRTLAGRYHISELIGTGGMATVYKGECELLKRDVAVKVLRDSVKSDEESLRSFKKEAQAAAQLSHNNIVSVYDVGEEDGIDYIVMEYVKGETLKEYIKEHGPLPWQEACDFCIQICQALDAAHSKGVIHRDIKPQNILVTAEKELKVTDFGLARAAATETMSVGGDAMGSVHYISPEQARGGYTDARSDLYSLGIVLFEMLTGKVPFDGESAVAIALMHIEKDIPNVLTYNPSVPADLAKVVSKACAREQIGRYQSAAEFADDLRSVLSSQPIGDYEPVDDESLGDTKKFSLDYDSDEQAPVKKKKQKKPKSPEQKKADKTATVLAFITIIVLLLLAFGGYMFLKRGSGEVVVPDFRNMLLEDAVALAQEKGITISDELEYSLSDDVEEGKIISQNPEARSFINRDEPVFVVVSIGSSGGNIEVPGVTGLDASEAITRIIEADLMYILNEEPSETVESGKVIRQSPEEGTKLNKDDVVTLHVSTGKPVASPTPNVPKTVVVPSLLGQTRDEAEKTLMQWDLKLISVSKKDSDMPEGTVISQSPEAGKQTTEGANVSIVISSGRPSETEDFTPPTMPPEQSESTPEKTESTGQLNTKTFTMQIPAGEGEALVKITLDGDTVYEKTKARGETVSIDLSGSGIKKLVAFIDGNIVAEQNVDFDE